MMPRQIGILAAALAAGLTLAAPPPAQGQVLTDRDCAEGSDFIRNAARSRENGMTREAFAERLEGDIAVVMQMPIESRWFVYGDAEAGLLRGQVADVFSDPQPPETHHVQFLRSCHRLRVELSVLRAMAPQAVGSAASSSTGR